MGLEIQAYFHNDTNSMSYLVYDPISKQASVIDPVLDFNAASAGTSDKSVNVILDDIKRLSLDLRWILETHVHADHLSGAQQLKHATGANIAIGASVQQIQSAFNDLYGFEQNGKADVTDFDRLLNDNEQLTLGDFNISVIHTPGHTPSCCTYVMDGSAFVGDTLFMPDYGTARCDFPGGNAKQLYQSIQKILSLPDNTKLYMCHDYMPDGREVQWLTSVAQQKQFNIHIKAGVSELEFITLREQRDTTLSVPKLMLAALQVNIRAGKLPPQQQNGVRYLKLPLNQIAKHELI